MISGTINGRPIIRVEIANQVTGQALNLDAVIDTGASHSSVTQYVINTLNPPLYRVAQMTVGNGATGPSNTYWLRLMLPNHANARMMEFATIPHPLNGIHVLLGMDVLSLGTFTLNGNTFTFLVPSLV